MKLLKIDELPWDKIPDKKRKVFLRVDFNVPLKNGKVLDDFRIQQSLPTIRHLLERKAVLIIGAHLGRPQGNPQAMAKYSLLPAAERLAELLEKEVFFSEEMEGYGLQRLITECKPGEGIVFLENLRFVAGEEANDAHFAEKLSELGLLYINDAFGACHRAHASVAALPDRLRTKAMGDLLARELEVLGSVLHSPSPQQMAILGGAKLEDKIQVMEALLKTCRKICVGGRMGLSFLAAQNYPLGGSRMDAASVQTAKRLLAEARRRQVEILTPLDGQLGKSLDATESRLSILTPDVKIEDDEFVLDIGPATLESWTASLEKADRVLWNGPMGVFENPLFAKGTLGLVDFLQSRRENIQTVAGGGETVAAITQRGALKDLWHVSTGGGAMLEFLEGRALPGVESLRLRDREIQQIWERDYGI
jgi:phosphoglycerate kinase